MTPRRSHSPRLAAALLAAALLPGAAAALSVVEAPPAHPAGHAPASMLTVAPGVRVSPLGLYPEYWPYGYLDHRFLVENTSAQRLVISLHMPENRYSGGLQSLSRTVVIDPGASAHVSLPQPPVRLGGSKDLVVTVQGGERKSRNLRGFPDLPHHWDMSSGSFGLLVSRSLSAETLQAFFESNTVIGVSASSRPSRTSDRFTRPELDVDAWSPDWRAYTPYAGVLLAGRDWPRVPADVREALLAYVRAGGLLLLAGPVEAPESLPLPAAGETGSFYTNGMHRAAHGLGAVLRTDGPDPANWSTNLYVQLHGAFTTADEPWRQKPDFDAAHRACPVVEGLRVPARAFFLTLLAFALLAGPGVMLYTRRRNNRLLRFILIPALSLVTTAGILVFALIHDGLTASVRLDSLTWLDTVTQRAATVGSVGVYAPFTPGDGLRFETETEIIPLGDFAVHYRTPHCTVDWSRNQHLASGWLRPRVPAYFHVRRSEKRRERLIVTRAADQSLEVVNALGGDLRALTLRDFDATLLRAGPIRAGGRARLEPVEAVTDFPTADAQVAESLKRKADNWGLDALWFNPSNRPPRPEPGRFIALLDASPFLENPMPGPARVQARAVVVGNFRIEPEPGTAGEGDRP